MIERLEQYAEEAKRIAEEEAAREAAENLRTKEAQEAYTHIGKFMTTGFSFDDYKVDKYKSIVSAQCIIGTGLVSEFAASITDFFGTESNAFSTKLDQAKDTAIDRLKRKAVIAGANAIIGVDFDYITFANNMLGVIANGTAVVISKIEE